jgi:hypothetical protein
VGKQGFSNLPRAQACSISATAILLESSASAVRIVSHVTQQFIEISESQLAIFLRVKRGAAPVVMEEEQAFLQHEERAEEDGGTSFQWAKSQPRSTSPLTSLPVHNNIHL